MPEISELLTQFSSLGIELDDETVAACLDICCRYSLDEESFVNSWIAYSVSNLGGANPTKENLGDFERKELATAKTPKRSTVSSNVQVFSSGKSNGKPVIHSADCFTPPRSSSLSSARTPSSSKKLIFSPLVFTPDVFSPSDKFNSRKNRGHVVCSYGKTLMEYSSQKSNFEVSTYNPIDTSKWKFLYDSLHTISDATQNRFERLAADIVKANKLKNVVPFDDCGIELRTFQGTVMPFDKMKAQNSIEIIGFEDSKYKIISLDLTDVEEFAIFPGQVIVFKGVLVGKTITARKIFTSAPKPLANPPLLNSHCQILVAAGPFTLTDTLSYEPLDDLIDLVSKQPPNILVLVGPLVDANHPMIAQGQIAESFSDFYSKIVKNIGDKLENQNMQVAIIASSKDANNVPVFPTPPALNQNVYKNVKFFPDPSVLFVDGLVLGITSVDPVFHLGKHELSNCQANRLSRLAAHTIRQQNFYPLYPPESDACIDVTMWAQEAELPVTPHVMILPSDMHGFIKEADDSLMLNPGKLTKGLAGGTYALIEARPFQSDEEWTVSAHVSARIVRI